VLNALRFLHWICLGTMHSFRCSASRALTDRTKSRVSETDGDSVASAARRRATPSHHDHLSEMPHLVMSPRGQSSSSRSTQRWKLSRSLGVGRSAASAGPEAMRLKPKTARRGNIIF
jgi:hypothetical protein